MDTTLADSGVDHDPSFGISDGTSFVGYEVIDKTIIQVLFHVIK